MFTGIIEETGVISSIKMGTASAIIHITADTVLKNTKIGDSIAVNGVCLTVTSISNNSFTADIMHETINRSSLAQLRPGKKVNLERAMAADGRFGGHIVSGHIDGTGVIKKIQKDDNAIWYHISAAPQILRYIVEKGSITIDGISLTVAAVSEQDFSISAIPHTVSVTTLCDRACGDLVNLETDIIGKYVEKLLIPTSAENKSSKITMDFLAKHGY